MAEFPHLGERCSILTCQQLDFLPLTCVFCQDVFCKLHYANHIYMCNAREHVKNPSSSSSLSTSNGPPETCSFEGCPQSTASILTQLVTCESCSARLCLQHRNQMDHACPSLVRADDSQKMSKTRQLVHSITSSKPASERKAAVSHKNEKLQAKVQLMKLKQSAQGNQTIPPDDRVYLAVYFRSPDQKGINTKNMFVSRSHCLGKVIDTMSQVCGVTNPNNCSTSSKTLRLFHLSDGTLLAGDASTCLSQLLSDGSILNGQSVILDLVLDADGGLTHPELQIFRR